MNRRAFLGTLAAAAFPGLIPRTTLTDVVAVTTRVFVTGMGGAVLPVGTILECEDEALRVVSLEPLTVIRGIEPPDDHFSKTTMRLSGTWT